MKNKNDCVKSNNFLKYTANGAEDGNNNCQCNQCPRKCNVNRALNVGYCGASGLTINKISKHFWEEPTISGTMGSGTIFFSGCNLKCIYCQNYKISSEVVGKRVTQEQLIEIFKKLEKSNVHNINLVTPTHFANEIISALKIYKPNIPIVWNTNGYESCNTIKMLKNYVDIFLTDIKYFSPILSKEYSSAEDYFKVCSSAVLQMKKNQPKDIFKNGIMQKGVIVRHLVLPGASDDSVNILKWIKQNMGQNTIISLMSQYTPYYKALDHPVLKNKLKTLEYKKVLCALKNLGFENGFTQQMSSSSTCFIPDFENENLFEV